MTKETKIRQILLEELEREKADRIWDRIVQESDGKFLIAITNELK